MNLKKTNYLNFAVVALLFYLYLFVGHNKTYYSVSLFSGYNVNYVYYIQLVLTWCTRCMI